MVPPSDEKPSSRSTAAIWAILEHLYSEMVAGTPFKRGLLDMLLLSLFQIPLIRSVVFFNGKKVLFQLLFKNIGEKLAIPFSPKFKNSFKKVVVLSILSAEADSLNIDKKVAEK
jgi:hypothetical protein